MSRILVIFDSGRELRKFKWDLGKYAFNHRLDIRGSGNRIGVGQVDYSLVLHPGRPGCIPVEARGVEWDEVWALGTDPDLLPLASAVAGFNRAKLTSAPRLIPPGERLEMREVYRRGEQDIRGIGADSNGDNEGAASSESEMGLPSISDDG